MEEIKAVVFDIDGTVTPYSNSWLALTRGLGASVEEHKALFFQGFKEDQVSHAVVREQLTKLWRSTGHATRSYIETMFLSWPILPEAVDLISFLKKKEIHVAFISASMDMHAKIVADKFSVSDYYASGALIFDTDGNLTDFDFPLDEIERKREHLHAFCKSKSIEPKNIVALGDSSNDVGIFSETGRGILVGLEKPNALKKVAWKEAENLREVKEILQPLLT